MTQALQGRIALVTGGSRGIGLGVARVFLSEGASVAVCARGEKRLLEAARSLAPSGERVLPVPADITQAPDAERLVEETLKKFSTIDILVNNAGILGPMLSILDYPVDAWDAVIASNLRSVFLITKAALPTMIENKRGSIINVSSSVGRAGRAIWGAYAVAKHGVEGLNRVLAEEVKRHGIRVNAINPGGTRTEMRAQAYPEEDPSTLPAPEEVARAFVYLASDASGDLTGASLNAREWLKDNPA